VIPVAWGITVALAVAPNLTVKQPSPYQWVLFAALLCVAMIPFLWNGARPLRTYASMLILLTLLAVFFWNTLPTWMSRQAWFPDSSGYEAAFITQTPKLVAAFMMITVLALIGYRRQDYFVTSNAHGKLWIGSAEIAALFVGLAVLVYSKAGPAGVSSISIVRYLPLTLLLAAMNSFAEEVLYAPGLVILRIVLNALPFGTGARQHTGGHGHVYVPWRYGDKRQLGNAIARAAHTRSILNNSTTGESLRAK
jgi:hypothetical protein